MKRSLAILAWSLVTMVVTAGSALAQASNDYPPATDVEGGTGGTGGGTAFTGGDVTMGLVLAVGLLVLGVTALVLARKRAARLAG